GGSGMTQTLKWEQRPEWRPKIPSLEVATERLSVISGIAPVIDMFIKSSLFMEFQKCLPQYISNNSNDTVYYALLLLAGFWIGYDCLNDFEKLKNDPVALEIFGDIAVPRSFGNFLRAFSLENIL